MNLTISPNEQERSSELPPRLPGGGRYLCGPVFDAAGGAELFVLEMTAMGDGHSISSFLASCAFHSLPSSSAVLPDFSFQISSLYLPARAAAFSLATMSSSYF